MNIAWHLVELIGPSAMHATACARTSWVAAARPFPVVSLGPVEVEGSSTIFNFNRHWLGVARPSKSSLRMRR